MGRDPYPRRIVCLTEETVETLYLLGEDHRIAGVSGYAVRPPRVRKEKPRVSAFVSADLPKILALAPDLVLAFSDLQADIVADLARAGLDVHVFNQRGIDGIFAMIATLAALVGAAEKGAALIADLDARLGAAKVRAAARAVRPRVYFEEWDAPMICGIGWVSQLVEIAGGIDIFADRAQGRAARERFVSEAEVIARAPDMVIGSWCGKKFNPARFAARPGFAELPAVRAGRLHEIKSSLILQPGPAAFTDGLDALLALFDGFESERLRTS
ncbi:ABC transporter substrate-binding protein [Roseixanthobacter pseudopolyaromaticivorans]|uniref:ABC transporter substrate-binding protein n=1 Tax=Xanthobacteraceae TaxID=335928 RepID=UPI00372C0003